MTDRAIGYQQCRYVLVASVGRGNWGDEAMLVAALARYGAANSVVLSVEPQKTQALHGCQAISRRAFRTVSQYFQNGAVLVFIGGSQFQNITSWGSLLYHALLVLLARTWGATVIMEGQGWGPFTNSLAEGLAMLCLRLARQVEFRDARAYERLKTLGPPMALGLDPVFRLPIKVIPYKTVKRSVALVLRPHALLTEERRQTLYQFCQTLQTRWGKRLFFIPLALPEDLALAEWFVTRLQTGDLPATLVRSENLDTLMNAIKAMQLVFSMRYHGCVFAEWLQVDYVGLSYDPKVQHHCELFKRPCLPIHDLNADTLHYLWVHYLESVQVS